MLFVDNFSVIDFVALHNNLVTNQLLVYVT